MILLIDNYDSFVYNLERYFAELGCQTQVVRNDDISLAVIESLNPAAIVISPGPCTPREAGISVDVVRTFGSTIPLLGVCLGHQAIAAAFGAEVVRAPEPIHGRTSSVFHNGGQLFNRLPNPLRATRYHSLIVSENGLPDELSVTARTEDGVVMAIEHRSWPVFGVQFHPESVLSEAGHSLLSNFLTIVGIEAAEYATHESSSANNFVDRNDGPHWMTDEPTRYPPLHW